jgi:hypothetical protein
LISLSSEEKPQGNQERASRKPRDGWSKPDRVAVYNSRFDRRGQQ